MDALGFVRIVAVVAILFGIANAQPCTVDVDCDDGDLCTIDQCFNATACVFLPFTDPATYRDDFNEQTFTNSDGNLPWEAYPWVENEGTQNATGGFITIGNVSNTLNFFSAFVPLNLVIERGLLGSADVFDEAILEVIVQSISDYALAILVSSDGGSSFTTVGCIREGATTCNGLTPEFIFTTGPQVLMFNITSFIASDMAVRLHVFSTGPDFGIYTALVSSVLVMFDAVMCDDGDACTVMDMCSSGTCVGTPGMPEIACGDNNACTTDTCMNDTCSNTPFSAVATECDGFLCTQEDQCSSGTCVSGIANNTMCEDVNDCITMICNATNVSNDAKGCVNTTDVTNGTPCSVGNPCVMDMVCMSGLCAGGSSVVCPDDDNTCTIPDCDPMSGCSLASVSDGTDCPSPCSNASMCMATNATHSECLTVENLYEQVGETSNWSANFVGGSQSTSYNMPDGFTWNLGFSSTGPTKGTGTSYEKTGLVFSLPGSSYTKGEITFTGSGTVPQVMYRLKLNGVTVVSSAVFMGAVNVMIPAAVLNNGSITVRFELITSRSCNLFGCTPTTLTASVREFSIDLYRIDYFPNGTLCETDSLPCTLEACDNNGGCFLSGLDLSVIDTCGVCTVETTSSPIVVTTATDVINPTDGEISIREAISIAKSRGTDQEIQIPGGTFPIAATFGEDDLNCVGDFDV